ncbi:hypothetical protein H0H87_009265 [Tephrocybe sp. NHM501043]|nr:hypothetical protein H0H87_009265 [Tephrocybe sp. NHM501043]
MHHFTDIHLGWGEYRYTIDTLINQGTVSDLRVIDYLGDEYASADVQLGPDGQQTLNFTLDTAGVGLGFFMDTQLDTVNVSSRMVVGLEISGVSCAGPSVWTGVVAVLAGVGMMLL